MTLAAILNVPFVERIFRYCSCRAALYCMNYISLSLENYHIIMLNTIRHLNNFQDGRKIQNGRQIEDYSHIYIHIFSDNFAFL